MSSTSVAAVSRVPISLNDLIDPNSEFTRKAPCEFLDSYSNVLMLSPSVMHPCGHKMDFSYQDRESETLYNIGQKLLLPSIFDPLHQMFVALNMHQLRFCPSCDMKIQEIKPDTELATRIQQYIETQVIPFLQTSSDRCSFDKLHMDLYEQRISNLIEMNRKIDLSRISVNELIVWIKKLPLDVLSKDFFLMNIIFGSIDKNQSDGFYSILFSYLDNPFLKLITLTFLLHERIHRLFYCVNLIGYIKLETIFNLIQTFSKNKITRLLDSIGEIDQTIFRDQILKPLSETLKGNYLDVCIPLLAKKVEDEDTQLGKAYMLDRVCTVFSDQIESLIKYSQETRDLSTSPSELQIYYLMRKILHTHSHGFDDRLIFLLDQKWEDYRYGARLFIIPTINPAPLLRFLIYHNAYEDIKKAFDEVIKKYYLLGPYHFKPKLLEIFKKEFPEKTVQKLEMEQYVDAELKKTNLASTILKDFSNSTRNILRSSKFQRGLLLIIWLGSLFLFDRFFSRFHRGFIESRGGK